VGLEGHLGPLWAASWPFGFIFERSVGLLGGLSWPGCFPERPGVSPAGSPAGLGDHLGPTIAPRSYLHGFRAKDDGPKGFQDSPKMAQDGPR
jgi:hypothetical protein